MYSALLVLLLLAILAGISVGSISVAPVTVATVLAANVLPQGWIDVSSVSEADRVVVWLIRTPRVLVAALVGAALALAGAQMQGLFHNPLASPDLVGTSAGGAFGAVLAIACGLATRSLWYVPLLAFLGAMGALCAVYAIATQRGRTPVATLLLAGVALSALISAATSLVISLQFVNYQVAQEIVFWLMGGLDSRTWVHVGMVAPCVALGALMAFAVMRELDVLLLGEEAAASLGVDVEHMQAPGVNERGAPHGGGGGGQRRDWVCWLSGAPHRPLADWPRASSLAPGECSGWCLLRHRGRYPGTDADASGRTPPRDYHGGLRGAVFLVPVTDTGTRRGRAVGDATP